MSELFDGVLATGPVRPEVGDSAWLKAMLDFESALAEASADAGLFERAHADRIARTCREAYFDLAELGARAAATGNPAAPLVRELTAKVGGEAAAFVHFGATSQDVLDTAAMLVAVRALKALRPDLRACADLAASFAETHSRTVQAGRTLLQQALPVTFGLVAAGWLAGLDAAGARLDAQRPAVQLGGATGTLASLGAHGPAVVAALAARLELAEPALPWHTERSRVTDLASALGQACGTVSGIARAIVLLAQTEVAEVREVGPGGSGGSSTMPHKRNPVAAVAADACARQAPGLVAALLGSAAHEHQRAAGAWHAEWRPFAELLRSTGSAVHWLRTSLERLEVDPGRMRANLDTGGGVMLAERVTTELVATSAGRDAGIPAVGRLEAHDAVARCCERALAGAGDLVDLLAADPLVGSRLSARRISDLLDPAGYLGSAAVFAERAVALHRAARGRTHRERGEGS